MKILKISAADNDISLREIGYINELDDEFDGSLEVSELSSNLWMALDENGYVDKLPYNPYASKVVQELTKLPFVFYGDVYFYSPEKDIDFCELPNWVQENLNQHKVTTHN